MIEIATFFWETVYFMTNKYKKLKSRHFAFLCFAMFKYWWWLEIKSQIKQCVYGGSTRYFKISTSLNSNRNANNIKISIFVQIYLTCSKKCKIWWSWVLEWQKWWFKRFLTPMNSMWMTKLRHLLNFLKKKKNSSWKLRCSCYACWTEPTS